MDLQRSLLIGAIAVLSFMLLTKWVDFKDAKTSTQTQEKTRLISADPADGTPDLPNPLHMKPRRIFPPCPPAPPRSPRILSLKLPWRQDHQIHTDVLQMAVDLQGGDVVELALPGYPAELDKPAVPFVLLEQNTNRTLYCPERPDRQQRHRQGRSPDLPRFSCI